MLLISEIQYPDDWVGFFFYNLSNTDRSEKNQSAEIERVKCIARANGMLSSTHLPP